MAKNSKPIIGWIPCQSSFCQWPNMQVFTQGPQAGDSISLVAVMKHWREGTAKFLPNADKMCHQIAKLEPKHL